MRQVLQVVLLTSNSSKPSLNTLDTRADIAARAKGNNEGNQEEQSKLKKMATSLKSIVGKSEEQIRKDQEEDQKQQEYWRKRLAKQKEDEELHLKELARQKAELEKMLDRVSNPQDGQSGT